MLPLHARQASSACWQIRAPSPPVIYELDYYRLVHGGIRVSHPRDDASGHLVQANRPMGSSPILGDRDLGGGDCRVGTASDACAECRGIRRVNVVGAHPRVYPDHLHRRFCAALFQRRATVAWLDLRPAAVGSDRQLFLRAKYELSGDHQLAACSRRI